MFLPMNGDNLSPASSDIHLLVNSVAAFDGAVTAYSVQASMPPIMFVTCGKPARSNTLLVIELR